MKPQDPPPRTGIFATLLESALVGRQSLQAQARHALDMGVRPIDIVRYVQGSLEPDERAAFQESMVHSLWALRRVSALTKAHRSPNSLGSMILASPILRPYAWGVQRTGDPEMDAATLLDAV